MRLLLLLLLVVEGLVAHAQLLIRDVTVVEVETGKLLPGRQVLVQNGRIAAVNKKVAAPAGVAVVDGRGQYLVPGFVDAHVHFFQSGGLYTRPDAIDLRKYRSYADEVGWTHRNMESLLRRYMAAGITTVVDVGATVNFLKQRDSFANKPYAPGIFMTGPLLTTWEPNAFRNLKDDEPFSEMKTVEDARRLVQQQLPYKPDFIKIWYIVNESNTGEGARKLLPLVQAVIEEAHRNKLRVAVHATERITAQLAVEAGADFLVHGIDDEPVDAAFVELLRTKQVVLSPTLVVGGNYNKAFGQTYKPSPEDLRLAHPAPLRSLFDLKGLPDTGLVRMYRNAITRNEAASRQQDTILRSNLKRLLDGGVTIATGTDAGNIGTMHSASYFDELRAMQASGFSLPQLLQASTINGAKAMGKAAEFGAVKQGMLANLVLLQKNPLESLDHWQTISAVINKGELLHPDSLVRPRPEDLADQQLMAYNAHNLEAFLMPYADDVEVYGFPNQLQIKGKEQMRKAYAFVEKTPALHCRLLNRIVQGNMVVDHEEVYGFGDKPVYAIAIYEVKNGKIIKVWFPR